MKIVCIIIGAILALINTPTFIKTVRILLNEDNWDSFIKSFESTFEQSITEEEARKAANKLMNISCALMLIGYLLIILGILLLIYA